MNAGEGIGRRRRQRRALLRIGIPAVLLAAVALLASVRVVGAQSSARQGLDERFHMRTENGAEFIASYAADLAGRQHAKVQRLLSGPVVARDAFVQAVSAFEVGDALLLDADGRVLFAYPHRGDLVGGLLPADHPHQRLLRQDMSAVSDVVPAGHAGVPMVAVATPVATPAGQRVFVGAYAAGDTPLGRFLARAVPITGADSWLVDSTGRVVASSRSVGGPLPTLADGDAALADRPLQVTAGHYDRDGESRHYAGAPIPGTPWTLVQTVSDAALYAPLGDGMVPGLTVGALCAMTLFAFALFGRLARSERRLAEAVRTDALTGLPNRRSMDEHLARAIGAARRSGLPAAVLMVDVDRFKQVNDTYGHDAGDAVLKAVGAGMRTVVRGGEIAGRWGGEEFLVLLPDTSAADAARVAERLRAAIEARPVDVRGTSVTVTASIGVAASASAEAAELVGRADDALYRAKAAGRNRVEPAGLEPSGRAPALAPMAAVG